MTETHSIGDHGDPASERLLRDLLDARQHRHGLARVEQALFVHYQQLPGRLARHWARRGIDIDDLVQIGRVGLLKAIRGWQPEPGRGFTPYALSMITGELRRAVRDHSTAVRPPRAVATNAPRIIEARRALNQQLGRSPTDRELAEEAGLSADAIRADQIAATRRRPLSLNVVEEIGSVVEPMCARSVREMELVEQRTALAAAIRQLPGRQQRILTMRFFEDRTQEEVGAEVGVSQMQVSRLLRQVLSHLRAAIAA